MKDFIPKIIEFAAFIIFVIAIVIYAIKEYSIFSSDRQTK
jgi:hypothetical protein